MMRFCRVTTTGAANMLAFAGWSDSATQEATDADQEVRNAALRQTGVAMHQAQSLRNV